MHCDPEISAKFVFQLYNRDNGLFLFPSLYLQTELQNVLEYCFRAEKQISFQSRIKLNWLSPARFFKILRYFQTEILIFEAKFEIKIFYFFLLLLLVVTSECNPKLQFIIMPPMYCGDSHHPTKCENQATLCNKLAYLVYCLNFATRQRDIPSNFADCSRGNGIFCNGWNLIPYQTIVCIKYIK